MASLACWKTSFGSIDGPALKLCMVAVVVFMLNVMGFKFKEINALLSGHTFSINNGKHQKDFVTCNCGLKRFRRIGRISVIHQSPLTIPNKRVLKYFHNWWFHSCMWYWSCRKPIHVPLLAVSKNIRRLNARCYFLRCMLPVVLHSLNQPNQN